MRRNLPALPFVALAACLALAGCGDLPGDPATPRLLSVSELRATQSGVHAASPAPSLATRAAALRARAAQMRRASADEDEELRRRALALAALGS